MTAARRGRARKLRCAKPFDSDSAAVGFAASLLEISEYRLFQIAYREWYDKEIPDNVMENFFSNYLAGDVVPFWLRDLVRRILGKYEAGQLNPTEFHVEPPQPSAAERRLGWILMMLLACLVSGYAWIVISSSHAISEWFLKH